METRLSTVWNPKYDLITSSLIARGHLYFWRTVWFPLKYSRTTHPGVLDKPIFFTWNCDAFRNLLSNEKFCLEGCSFGVSASFTPPVNFPGLYNCTRGAPTPPQHTGREKKRNECCSLEFGTGSRWRHFLLREKQNFFRIPIFNNFCCGSFFCSPVEKRSWILFVRLTEQKLYGAFPPAVSNRTWLNLWNVKAWAEACREIWTEVFEISSWPPPTTTTLNAMRGCFTVVLLLLHR